MTEPRQDALPVSGDVALAKAIESLELQSRAKPVTFMLTNECGNAILDALSRTTPAAPAPDMRGAAIQAIQRAETVSGRNNNETVSLTPYGWTFIYTAFDAALAALQLPDAKPTFRDGIEAAAKCADERAEALLRELPVATLSARRTAKAIAEAIRAIPTKGPNGE